MSAQRPRFRRVGVSAETSERRRVSRPRLDAALRPARGERQPEGIWAPRSGHLHAFLPRFRRNLEDRFHPSHSHGGEERITQAGVESKAMVLSEP